MTDKVASERLEKRPDDLIKFWNNHLKQFDLLIVELQPSLSDRDERRRNSAVCLMEYANKQRRLAETFLVLPEYRMTARIASKIPNFLLIGGVMFKSSRRIGAMVELEQLAILNLLANCDSKQLNEHLDLLNIDAAHYVRPHISGLSLLIERSGYVNLDNLAVSKKIQSSTHLHADSPNTTKPISTSPSEMDGHSRQDEEVKSDCSYESIQTSGLNADLPKAVKPVRRSKNPGPKTTRFDLQRRAKVRELQRRFENDGASEICKKMDAVRKNQYQQDRTINPYFPIPSWKTDLWEEAYARKQNSVSVWISKCKDYDEAIAEMWSREDR